MIAVLSRLRVVVLLSLGLALLPCHAAEGDLKLADWPIFRGNPLQTGVAASGLADNLEILWQFKTQDSVEGAAAIVNGTVYVASFDQHLYAIDLATGKEKWRYKAGPFKAPPSVRNGVVYIGDADGMFHAVDAATGKKLWTYETEGEISSGANFTKDGVMFGSGDEHLYCLSSEGKLRWKFKVPGGPVMATPAIVKNRTFVAGCDSALHIIDTDNGKEIASVELGGQVGATAAIVGDKLYVGTMTNQMLAIDWQKAEIVWTYEAPKRQNSFYASAAVTDSLVIVGSRDRRVHGINRKTGKSAWLFETDEKVDGSAVIVGERVFVGSFDSHLYVLDVAKGKELKKYKLDSSIGSSPAVGENRLIISTNSGTVYCFGTKK